MARRFLNITTSDSNGLWLFIAGMVLTFAIVMGILVVFSSLTSKNFTLLTEGDVIRIFGMSIRSTFSYNDSVTYKTDRWHIEDLNWTIRIYDSNSTDGVQGTALGDSTIYIRSGLMPTQIQSVCVHECVHLLGGGERIAYFLQWKADIPACSYLEIVAEEMFDKNQTKYHEVFG